MENNNENIRRSKVGIRLIYIIIIAVILVVACISMIVKNVKSNNQPASQNSNLSSNRINTTTSQMVNR